MRVIVTGSRDWRDVDLIANALAPLPDGTVIVHGCATGADAIARSIAVMLGFTPEDHWPDYANYSPPEAPKIRNQRMVDAGADHCYAFPTRGSRGTWDCINRARDAKIPTTIFHPDGTQETY